MKYSEEFIDEMIAKIEEQTEIINCQQAVIVELTDRLNTERERLVRRHGLTLLEVTR